MSDTQATINPSGTEVSTGASPAAEDGSGVYDVVVIGAGVTGLYALYRLRELGLSVRVYEEGTGVGGTWYWNRYPGSRFDTESPTYSYSFSEELLDEWDWKETYSAQPDNERYLNLVADKFDLRPHIELGARVSSLEFDEGASEWAVTLVDGKTARGRFVITAVGKFSSAYLPAYPGVDSFQGACVHTGRWPTEGVDLAGKRVAVIGTGPTGVQVIPEVAKVAEHLTVFQRTANYCGPLRNSPIDAAAMGEIRANYSAMFAKCNENLNLMYHHFDPRSGEDLTSEERIALYEQVWAEQGRAGFNTLFREVWQPGPINEEFSGWFRGKIRAQIDDPDVAEKLVPHDHNFATKRIPGELGYYAAFNRDNVELVSLREEPIEQLTRTGIKTSSRDLQFDVVIFATGWDVITGPLLAMDIRGEAGLTLKEKFADGLRSYMYLQCAGFPNMFIVNATSSGNFVRSTEPLLDWVGETIRFVLGSGHRRIAPTVEAEATWTAYVTEKSAASLMTKSSSSFIGANIPGKARVPLFPLFEGEKVMQERRAAVAANGYEGFELR